MIIFLLPTILIWPLNTSTQSKANVSIAFSFRIFIVPGAILHLIHLKGYQGQQEPHFAVTSCLVIQQLTLTVSLMSATLPNLGNFLKSFQWGFGFAGLEDGTITETPEVAYELQTIGNRSRCQENMRILGPPSEHGEHRFETTCNGLVFRPDPIQHGARAILTLAGSTSTIKGDEASSSRPGSRDAMIRKQVNWSAEQDKRSFFHI